MLKNLSIALKVALVPLLPILAILLLGWLNYNSLVKAQTSLSSFYTGPFNAMARLAAIKDDLEAGHGLLYRSMTLVAAGAGEKIVQPVVADAKHLMAQSYAEL